MKAGVIFISNGYSEDMMAAAVARSLLQGRDHIEVEGLPLVGPGAPYKEAGISVGGPVGEMPPSAGFSIRDRNIPRVWRDVREGLVGRTMRQAAYLARKGDAGYAAVAVGDAYALWMAMRTCRRPVFVDTPISAYIRPHRRLEIAVMRRAGTIFTRDEPTAAELRRLGLNARFAGSLMLDCLDYSEAGLDLTGETRVGLLPGSRLEAYDNLPVLLRIAAGIAGGLTTESLFLLAVAPTLDAGRLEEIIRLSGWQYEAFHLARGVIGRAQMGGAALLAIRGFFGDILGAADLVIGQAGTASEQAVGLGCPLLAFPGRGPQVRERFLRTQKRLLGKAMELLPADEGAVASRALTLLQNRNLLEEMSRAGRERMGGGGGVEAVAAHIDEALENGRGRDAVRE